jgi:hypothetical protein
MNVFTTDLLRMAITSNFAYVHFTEDKTGVPCPIASVRWIRAGSGNELTFAIDFTWQEWHQPYPDYVIRTLIEFKPNGDFRIHKAEGHSDLSDWVEGWKGAAGIITDELASMCICDFNKAYSDQVLDVL